MRFLVVLAVAGLAFWFVGSRLIDRGQDLSAVAKSSEQNIRSVAEVLRQAKENAKGYKQPGAGLPGEASWADSANRVCNRQSDAFHRLSTPRSLDEIAVYAADALPILRRFHARFASIVPPGAFVGDAGKVRRAFKRQELGVARVHTAASRGDSSGTIDEVDALQALARATNPMLVKLRLNSCTLPAWGLPLL
jgi:hypothetical protein